MEDLSKTSFLGFDKQDHSTDSSKNSNGQEFSEYVTLPSSYKEDDKKHYAVTSDEVRTRFIMLWSSGTNSIKSVSPIMILIDCYYRLLLSVGLTIALLSR